MNLVELLQSKGVRTYGEAIWKADAFVTNVKCGDNVVVVASEKFENVYQMVIKEGNTTMYIPLKSGTDPNLPEYKLQQFVAMRDWEERKILKGEIRVFAVAP